jgi:hypothetical protein
VLDKFATVMIDVHLPTTNGRELVLTRYVEPEPGLHLLLKNQARVARSTATQNHRQRSFQLSGRGIRTGPC